MSVRQQHSPAEAATAYPAASPSPAVPQPSLHPHNAAQPEHAADRADAPPTSIRAETPLLLAKAQPGVAYHPDSWAPAAAAGLSAIRDLCDPYLNLFRNIIPPIFDTLDVSPLLAFAVLGTLGSILNSSRGMY